ncbi:MAG: OmpA family protein [Flavobacteriales bacterium]|nr:OmpA family protein [Flavobacteriales bacterium]
MLKPIFIILCLIYGIQLSAQVETPFDKKLFKEQKDQFKEAMNHIKEGDNLLFDPMIPRPRAAVIHYLKANEFNPNSSELNFKIAQCYLAFDKYKMKPYVEKAYKLKPTVNPLCSYLLAQAYQLESEWKTAIQYYNIFISSANTPDLQEHKKNATRKIQECKNGEMLEKDQARVWIDNVGPMINSQYPDYAPVISADEAIMVFTARRPDQEIMAPDGGHFEDLYQSIRYSGDWQKSANMGSPLNTKGQHDATIGISPDGQVLFLYINRKGNGGDIYTSLKEGGVWTKPQPLGKNINTSAHEPDASLSFDGNRLYFTSNKDGGFGEHDIYYSDWDTDKERWGEAVNIGNVLNTPYEERSVFIHPDGETMYFSSQGHNSMGGFDIFYSKLVNGQWQKPVNMGPPLNTPDDDIQLVVAGNGRFGYYSSYRQGGHGEKDIYVVTFLGPPKQPILANEDNLIASIAEPIKEKTHEPELVAEGANMAILTGIIRDKKTKQPLKASIVLVDNTANKVIAEFESDDQSGKYLVSLPGGANYGIAVKKDGYLFHSENFVIPEASGFKQYKKDADLKKVEVGESIVLRNIFFDLDKYSLRPESVNELERLHKLLVENPTMRIEISGHTDTRGGADHNQELSQNRAKAVVDYLVQHGVDKSRLEFAGYGESKTIISDGEIAAMKSKSSREEAHQQNRRTEFKVLSM